jgi:hypothetical protein
MLNQQLSQLPPKVAPLPVWAALGGCHRQSTSCHLFVFCLSCLVGYTCLLFCFDSGLFQPVRPACFCAGLFSVLGWTIFDYSPVVLGVNFFDIGGALNFWIKKRSRFKQDILSRKDAQLCI